MRRPLWARLRKSERGFTLAEAAIALALIAILASTAVIKMGSWDKAEKLRAAEAAVYQILQQTRIQAITRGMNWSIQDSLSNDPFGFDVTEATLTRFAQAAADDPTISVSEDNITFTARGRRDNLTQVDILITGADGAYRTVRVGGDGLVELLGVTGPTG